jgi:hypothetical protein
MLKVYWKEIEHNWRWGSGETTIPAFSLLRAKVPGGWLVTIQGAQVQTQKWGEVINHYEAPGGITFIPDPNYLWETQS